MLQIHNGFGIFNCSKCKVQLKQNSIDNQSIETLLGQSKLDRLQTFEQNEQSQGQNMLRNFETSTAMTMTWMFQNFLTKPLLQS